MTTYYIKLLEKSTINITINAEAEIYKYIAKFKLNH